MIPIVVAAILMPAGCTSQQAGQVSKDLADQMTDSMSFTNGLKVSGAPPVEHKGVAAYPQVTSIDYDGPGTLSPGDTFKLTVKTDFPTRASISGAAVYVWNTEGVYTSYIMVSSVANADGKVELSGTFTDNAWLNTDSQDFRLMVALGTGASESFAVGNYAEKTVTAKGTGGGEDHTDSPYCQNNKSEPEGCTDSQTCYTSTACWYVADGKRFDCTFQSSVCDCTGTMTQVSQYCGTAH
jgi:hypothetical protein